MCMVLLLLCLVNGKLCGDNVEIVLKFGVYIAIYSVLYNWLLLSVIFALFLGVIECIYVLHDMYILSAIFVALMAVLNLSRFECIMSGRMYERVKILLQIL